MEPETPPVTAPAYQLPPQAPPDTRRKTSLVIGMIGIAIVVLAAAAYAWYALSHGTGQEMQAAATAPGALHVSCADSGQVGAYPVCHTAHVYTCEESGLLGTYPDCSVPPTPRCSDFGESGSYPSCNATITL